MMAVLDARYVATHFDFVDLYREAYKSETVAANKKNQLVHTVEMEDGYIGVIIGLAIPAVSGLTYKVKADGYDLFEADISRSIGSIANPRQWDMDKSPLPTFTSKLQIWASESNGAQATAEVLVEVARFRIPDGFDTRMQA